MLPSVAQRVERSVGASLLQLCLRAVLAGTLLRSSEVVPNATASYYQRVVDITPVRRMLQGRRGIGQSLDVTRSTDREHYD